MFLTGPSILTAWLASIVLHALALVVMFYLVFPFSPDRQEAVPEARAELIGSYQETAYLPVDAPDLSKHDDERKEAKEQFKPRKFDRLSELTASKKPALSIIGIGAGGGDFAQYGLTVGSGGGPVFFGLGGSAQGAKRIVYVVDRSGSMLGTFTYVRRELERSIGGLRRSQKFHVIFFSAGTPLENPPGKLVSAIRARKEHLFEFLKDVHPEGSTNPEPAMRRALALEPDLIYFLTDGEFSPTLIEKLDRWNEDRRVKIFTIAYFDRRGAVLLERIAREHGGKFRFFSEHDLP